VAEQASPTIEANTCTGSAVSGIGYFEAATGTRTRTPVPHQRYGISVSGHAKPTLEGNVLQENGLNGLIYQDNSGGIANNNQCTGNGKMGSPSAAGAPVVDGNRQTRNRSTAVRRGV